MSLFWNDDSDDYLYISSTPNRYMCKVLEEMRTLLTSMRINSRQRALLLSMVEEIQIMGNRMEAGLEDSKDIRNLITKRSRLRREVQRLEDQKELLLDKSKKE